MMRECRGEWASCMGGARKKLERGTSHHAVPDGLFVPCLSHSRCSLYTRQMFPRRLWCPKM